MKSIEQEERLKRILRNQERIEKLLAELQRMSATVDVAGERGKQVKLRVVED